MGGEIGQNIGCVDHQFGFFRNFLTIVNASKTLNLSNSGRSKKTFAV